MLHNILEISKKTSKGGRVPIKIALHKIHSDPFETNKNGLHWKKEYVLKAIDSAKMMPICAEFFTEEKDVPLGHGLTGSMTNSDGLEEPEFLNSETVGVIETASIEEFGDDENKYEMLVGNGYLYVQRYPNFVDWVRKNYSSNKVETSIEITGLPENDNKIIYEEAEPKDEYRTPMAFLYSGTAVLSVDAADDKAIVLEVAQKHKKEEPHMDFNMDEVKSVIKSTMTELNEKSEVHNAEIKKLNDQISELNNQLTQRDSEIAEKEAKISELNASVAEMQKLLDQMEKDRETYWTERNILEQEIAKAKVAEKLAELDDALGEFSEDEKAVAKDDIEKLKKNISACEKKDELNEVTSEINAIKSKICVAIVEAQKKEGSQYGENGEQNSTKKQTVDIEDIFSEMCSETTVGNEDTNIF